ncbi:MAG: DM13 domain-containing protein [Actinomycetota bacterium]
MNLTQNKPLLGGVAIVVVAFLAWLAFGFFGIQAAFIDNEVNEAGPIFTATAAEQDATAETEEFQEAMADAEENRTESDESADDAMPDTEPAEIVTQFSGQFSGESRYEITGDALVLNDGSEQRFLRFENFDSDNGPDLKVYLRADDGSFVSLGNLKGNIGDQNYEIPTDVDLTVFSTVEIWCERFGVGFGGAELMAA